MLSVMDGDKINVSIEGNVQELNFLGADAPEPGECYAAEATAAIKELLPTHAVLYLERDTQDLDNRDRLLRHVWTEGKGGKAYLVNAKLVRDGIAGWKSQDAKDGNAKYAGRYEKAQADAKKSENGLWAECDRLHSKARTRSEQTKAAEAVPTDVPATEAPAVEVGDLGYDSGGLGLALSDWERRHGAPVDGPLSSSGYRYYENGRINLIAWENGNVWNLEVQFGGDGVPVTDAQALATLYMPADRVFLQSYPQFADGLSDNFVELYNSPSLATRLPADLFNNGNLGDFIVIYHVEADSSVTSLLFGVGNNP